MPDNPQIRSALVRLADRAGAELATKAPHWGDAILCDGLTYAARATGSRAALESAAAWFAPRLATGPRLQGWFWFWAAEALTALDLYLASGDSRHLEYARTIVREFRTSAAATPSGAISPHPPALDVWIDVAYFTAPAAARLGRITDDATALEWAIRQMLAHQRCLLDDSTGLFWHVAYGATGGHSPCRWARGNSWYSIAATQVLEDLDASGAKDNAALRELATPLRAALARQLNAVARFQDASGLWHTVIDRSDSYLESSATAGFALALGRAVRTRAHGLDPDAARNAYTRALDAIRAKIDPAGEFTGVSQQTPPGDFNFYNSVELGTASFGTGVCLMALSEALAD